MLGDLKSSPIEQLRGRAASVEQGPVKLSVQTFGLLLTPTLAGLVPALSPALLHPAAHTCPDSTMMMYFWVSTAPLKCGYLLLLTPLRYAQSWRVERVWRMCQSVLQPLHYIQCEFERVCVCVWCSASHMHEQSWWFFHSRVFYWCWVAAARSYRGLCLPVTFVQPLNEIGCLGAIVIHANTFTSSSTSPPLIVKLPSMQLKRCPSVWERRSGSFGDTLWFPRLRCVSNTFCVILLFSSPIYLSQAEFHKLNGIKRRMRIITDC